MEDEGGESAFLARIAARHADDGPRLVYADWLDERNDPRGELVRVQCALEALPASDPRGPDLRRREARWLERHSATFAGALAGFADGWQFRRGLLDSVALSARAFLEHGQALFALAPVRRVRLSDPLVWLGEVLQTPHLARVRELDLCGGGVGNAGAARLARSPHVAQLESLDLGFCGLDDAGVATLSGCASFARLRSLALNDNANVGTRGAAALAGSPHLARLERLDLSSNDLGDDALRLILASPHLARLRRLALANNHAGDAGLALFLASERLPRLLGPEGVLEFRENNVGPVGAALLAASPALARVRELDLSGNSLGDRGVAALAGSPHAHHLRALRLCRNRLTDEALLALADAPWVARLERLDLGGNLFTGDGFAALTGSPHWPWRVRGDVFDEPPATLSAARHPPPRGRPGG